MRKDGSYRWSISHVHHIETCKKVDIWVTHLNRYDKENRSRWTDSPEVADPRKNRNGQSLKAKSLTQVGNPAVCMDNSCPSLNVEHDQIAQIYNCQWISHISVLVQGVATCHNSRGDRLPNTLTWSHGKSCKPLNEDLIPWIGGSAYEGNPPNTQESTDQRKIRWSRTQMKMMIRNRSMK